MQINAYKYIFVFLIQYFPTQNPDSHTSPTMLAIAFHSFLTFLVCLRVIIASHSRDEKLIGTGV